MVIRFVLGFSVIVLVMAAPLNDQEDNTVSLTPECPRITSRREWKARKPVASVPLPEQPVPYVVVHHGGIRKYCFDRESCASIVRSYQNMHLDDNGWWDIGYQFVIGEDGNIYQGRGWNVVGAHAPGYNTQSIGICIIGDFNDFSPNEAALKALRRLVNCGVTLGKIQRDYFIIGHRQTRSTECPGNELYKYVQSLPNWTNTPVPAISTFYNDSIA